MAIDQEKLRARRERENAKRKLLRSLNAAGKSASKIENQPSAVKVDYWPNNTKIARHNEELHKTSAYLAEQARATERAIDRKRWSHAL